MDGNYQNTQQEEEIFDEELQGMGIPFEDETAPKEMPKLSVGAGSCRKPCSSGEHSKETNKAMDATYAPVKKTGASLQARLIGCTKWLVICGGIAMLLWWFQINDLMAMQAAYPCIVVCGILGGFGVGMHAMR